MASLTPLPEVFAALRRGLPVLVTDDEGRENEGDAILAAELATPAWIAWMVRHTSGYLCAPMPPEVADRLDLPLMVEHNEDSLSTAYTVTVDAAQGVTTGISASDRARTLRVLADAQSAPTDLIRPGHIVPLRARPGGVLERPGHTEAAVDLMRLAGLAPVGVIGELVRDEDGEMMRFAEVQRCGAEQGLPVTTVAAIARHVSEHGYPAAATHPAPTTPTGPAPTTATHPAPTTATHPAPTTATHPAPTTPTGPASTRVRRAATTLVPTTRGTARMLGFVDRASGHEHVAIDFRPEAVSGSTRAATTGASATLVRVHSECLTGEILGSLKCECGPQLEVALDVLAREGGVLVYLRGHEGRGIGLVNKLRAYALQQEGLDTLDANLALGLPADARDFTAAGEMLADLGITRARVLTNNPVKLEHLTASGIEVVERVPLNVGQVGDNLAYLAAKRDRMGHLIAFAPTPNPRHYPLQETS
ncbi:3,4-dihydroxy-2-butanone-4-phosphate synthase [Micrococcales bacterium 31B]|nr:3,4-dihydroxy-2-butanone-4-phosphate synthase [Micrococcales bacterium 31B]